MLQIVDSIAVQFALFTAIWTQQDLLAHDERPPFLSNKAVLPVL